MVKYHIPLISRKAISEAILCSFPPSSFQVRHFVRLLHCLRIMRKLHIIHIKVRDTRNQRHRVVTVQPWSRILETCDNYRIPKYHSVFF